MEIIYIKKAIETISDIYSEYLLSETDTVNLKPYDEALQEVHAVLEQALQTQAERDKMRCENCKHEPKNPTSKTLPCSMCSIAYASYFESKENENENG